MMNSNILKLEILARKSLGQFSFFIVYAFLLIGSVNLIAQEDVTQPKVLNQEEVVVKPADLPMMSEIIPKASELSDRLMIIQGRDYNSVDVTVVKNEYSDVEKKLKIFNKNYIQLVKSEGASVIELNQLNDDLIRLSADFELANAPLTDAIKEIEALRIEWIAENEKWRSWLLAMEKEELPAQIKTSLNVAVKDTEKGLDLLVNELNVLLELQGEGYENKLEIDALKTKIGVLQKDNLENAFVDASHSFFSLQFYNQFDKKLVTKTISGIKTVEIQNEDFFANKWWIFVLQFLVLGLVLFFVSNNKNALENEKRYKFIADRPYSAAVFFSVGLVLVIFMYVNAPKFWHFFFSVFFAISFWRIIDIRVLSISKKNFLFVVIFSLSLMGFLNLINLPVPLFRLVVVALSLYGLCRIIILFMDINKMTLNSKRYLFFLRFISIYLLVILLSELFGKEILALYMYESLNGTILAIVCIYVFLEMIRVGLISFFKLIIKSNNYEPNVYFDKTVDRVSNIINGIVILFVLIPKLLSIWGTFDSLAHATDDLLSLGFTIGKNSITLGIIITSVFLLYGAFILSTIIEMILMSGPLESADFHKGTRLSLAQLIRYFLMFFGFLIALTVLGFDLTNFTIVLSALGVGIGFGLQGVVNNFVSGLILLFERPIREGDTIIVNNAFADVKKIGLRCTRVNTVEQADLLIPNSELVYNQVTNITLTNRYILGKISVGVAYGSDVALVIEILNKIASEQANLVKNKKISVFFQNFGESSLDFELRVWIKDADHALVVKSEIRQKIDAEFRKANIEIAFPQRDLHIRSVDKSITLK